MAAPESPAETSPASHPNRRPVSTYRLQLHKGFTFQDARALVPYLAKLGITTCYCSPFLEARPGSTHGYDICDHNKLNPEIGDRSGFEALAAELAAHGMGVILDFVPNHMGIDPGANLWWRDVLENGPSSPYAKFFDIDWDPVKPELKGKVLLPILGKQYGAVLESGQLQLILEEGVLSLRYFEHNLPINPRQAPLALNYRIETLEAEMGAQNPDLREFLSVITSLRNLPAYTETDLARIAERQREKEVARERFTRLLEGSPEIRTHVEENLREFNGRPGEPESFDRLHELLEVQAYRLSYWRTAGHEINYRRFFDINDLAGLSMEDPEVFQATHSLVLELIRSGLLHGLRLDHVDGLFNPSEYFERLQEAAGEQFAAAAATDAAGMTQPPEDAAPGGSATGAAPALYVLVEKILSDNEFLPESWKVHGTTGYEFLNEVNGLFVESRNAGKFKRIYARFTGVAARPEDVVYEAKKLVLTTSLASELNVLAFELNRISEDDRWSRDFTLDSLRDALREIIAVFPVYRTYVDEQGWREEDRRTIEAAVARARRRNPAMEPSIFDFVRDVLLPVRGPKFSEERFQRLLRFAMKFQQITGPVQAKGLEDTAFYRYVPLLSLNDVGGHLHRFGRSPAQFHEANERRLRRWPFAMLTTSTHDAKRGEDGRARLNILSEIPDEWRRELSKWSRWNASLRAPIDGEPAPDRNDEYLFYQALLGAWPNEAAEKAPPELVDRMKQYMLKALREAKTHTSWINPFEEYEQAVPRFVEQALAGPKAKRFLSSFLPFQRRVAQFGLVNSLSQVVLKIASPGVPDFYQGTELWDLNLVDPDNRRPVDYEHRRRLLETIEPLLASQAMITSGDPSPQPAGSPEGGMAAALAEMLEHWPDGRVKLYITASALRFRRSSAELFLKGDYIPLEAEPGKHDHIVAFARRRGDQLVIAVTPRLAVAMTTPERPLPIGAETWGEARLLLPPGFENSGFRNIFTGERVGAVTREGREGLPLAGLLKVCPVALLWGSAASRQQP